MDKAISNMTDRIVSIMDGNINSIWLYGSVVLNDFQPGWSDIDLLVLTESEITDAQAQKLLMLRQTLMNEERDNEYYRLFEGIIANIDEYCNEKYSKLVYWGTSGQRITEQYKQDAFSLFELARYSKSIYGKSNHSIFREPNQCELKSAVITHYETIRKHAQKTDERLYSCGWLLDIARCIYTLRYNDVISKTQAGIWALNEKLFANDSALRKTIEIRQNPTEFKERDDIKKWLQGLGPIVQKYADVLEREIASNI